MKFDSEKMQSLSSELQEINFRIASTFAEIDSIKTSLSNGSSWHGNAASYYASKLQTYSNVSNDVFESIQGSVFYLNSVIDQHKSLHEQIFSKVDDFFKMR